MSAELTAEGIKSLVKEAMREYDREKLGDKTYTVNQVRKRLGIAHETLTKRIRAGMIIPLADGRIAESEINRYLKNS
jgi:DNA-binding NtrC family response regulator